VSPEKIRDDAVTHYTELAKKPGCFAYARHQVHKLENDEAGLFAGIRAKVAQNLTGFEVPRAERGEWWK
jgi:hypothetical protein